MADAPIVHIGENSPEQVAFKLMEIVAHLEGKVLKTSAHGSANADRAWLLARIALRLLMPAFRKNNGRSGTETACARTARFP